MTKLLFDSSLLASRGKGYTLARWRESLVRIALLTLVFSPWASAPAQERNVTQPARESAPHYKRQNLDQRVELLGKYLDLNEEQKSGLKRILLERQQEILKMRRAPVEGNELQMDRFRAIEDKTAEKIRAILTEEQRKKYDPRGVRKASSASQNVSVEDWLKRIGPR